MNIINTTSASVIDATDKLLMGAYGIKAQIAGTAALANTLGFYLTLNVERSIRPAAAGQKMSDAAMVMFGVSDEDLRPADLGLLARGYMAAQLELIRLAKAPDPDNNGKTNAWAIKAYVRDAAMLAANFTDWQAKKEILRLQAEAAKIAAVSNRTVDTSAREAALRLTAASLNDGLRQAIDAELTTAFPKVKAATDLANLIHTAISNINDRAKDPVSLASIVVPAIERTIESLAKRTERGEYASLDSGIYAFMAGLRNLAKGETPPPDGETPAVA